MGVTPVNTFLVWKKLNHEPLTFRSNSKFELIVQYDQEICRDPDVYKDYLEMKKKQEKNEIEGAPDGDCIIL